MPSASTWPSLIRRTSLKWRTSSRRRAAPARSRNRFEVSFASPTGPLPSLSRAAKASFYVVCRLFVGESPAHRIAGLRDVALGEHDLEQVRVPLGRAEHFGAAVEIDPPDAAEALVEALRIELANALPVAVEALRPGVERERVAAAQVLDVQHFEAGALHLDDGIGKARDPAAGKHVAADEELGLEASDVADEMQHAEAAGLEEPGVRLHHLGELVAPRMLEGADRDHLVVLAARIAEIAEHLQGAAEPPPLDLAAHHVGLRGGGIDARDSHPEALMGVEHEAAESGADVDYLLARRKQQLPRHVVDLVPLRFLERACAFLPVRAGVHHQRVVEPQAVEIGAERVVAFGVLLRSRPAAVGVHELVPAVAHVREPVHPVVARLHAVRERRREAALHVELAKAMAAGMEGGMDRPKPLVRVRNWWHEPRFSNASWRQARTNADFHYALGPEFYRLWLDDPLMMYTCAYWKEGTRTLEEAQRNKIDHVARKLLLAPGEEVVDIGAGFGGFMFHAHERFGVRVTGVNTTASQPDIVRGEIERRRLGGTLQVLSDFRDARREYDKVVSIGTLEHAGRDQLAQVVQAHARFLKPGGLGMLHFIGHIGHFQTEFFIRRYVFPGGWIPSLADTIVEMERAGLEVLDIENLRRHYALTLDAWGERFDRNWERIRKLDPQRFDERFRRVWRVYLYGCAEMFRSPQGRLHLFQVLFSKGNVTRGSYPMGREFLYR